MYGEWFFRAIAVQKLFETSGKQEGGRTHSREGLVIVYLTIETCIPELVLQRAPQKGPSRAKNGDEQTRFLALKVLEGDLLGKTQGIWELSPKSLFRKSSPESCTKESVFLDRSQVPQGPPPAIL